MAYASDFFAAQSGLRGRVNSILHSVAEAREHRRVYTRTLAELHMLDARELADLGICEANIPEIAREAAYPAH